MRSIKLVPALAAMATLLALAPAGALAAKHPGLKRHRHAARVHAGACRLSLNAAPRFIEAGETAVVFGALACPAGTSAAGQAVTVLQRSAGTPGVSTAGTTTTDASGHYQLTTPALLTNSLFYATAAGAQSGQRPVKVSPKVTLSGPPDGSQLFTGGGPFIQLPRAALWAAQQSDLHRHRQPGGRRRESSCCSARTPSAAKNGSASACGQVGQGGTCMRSRTPSPCPVTRTSAWWCARTG